MGLFWNGRVLALFASDFTASQISLPQTMLQVIIDNRFKVRITIIVLLKALVISLLQPAK